jgi:hypothetical protein
MQSLTTPAASLWAATTRTCDFKTATLRSEVERLTILDDRTDMCRVAEHRDVFGGIGVEDDDIGDHPPLDRAQHRVKQLTFHGRPCSEHHLFRRCDCDSVTKLVADMA